MVAELAGLVYIVIDAAMTPVKGGGGGRMCVAWLWNIKDIRSISKMEQHR